MVTDDARIPVARSVSTSTQRVAMVNSSGSTPAYHQILHRLSSLGGAIAPATTSAAVTSAPVTHIATCENQQQAFQKPQMHWIGTPQSSTASLGIHKQSNVSTPRLVSNNSATRLVPEISGFTRLLPEQAAHTPRTTSEPPPSLAQRNVSIRKLPLQTLCQSANQQSTSMQQGDPCLRGRMLTPQRVRAPANSFIAATLACEAQMHAQIGGGLVRGTSADSSGTSDVRIVRPGQVQVATAIPSFLPLAQTIGAPIACSAPKGSQQAPPALERLKAAAAGYGLVDAVAVSGAADRAEEVLNALAKLQQTLDEQQADQRAIVNELSAQWEERFAQVLQGLQTSSSFSSTAPSSKPSCDRCAEMLGEIGRIWRHMDGLSGRLRKLDGEDPALWSPALWRQQPGADIADGEDAGAEVLGREARDKLQQTAKAICMEDGDNDLARRRWFNCENADGGSRVDHRLDLVDTKLHTLSEELELLRSEVATSKVSQMPTAELRTSSGSPSSTLETCMDDMQQQSVNQDKVASFRMPKPRSTGAGLLPPLDKAEESPSEEDMVCGAGSPPRRSDEWTPALG